MFLGRWITYSVQLTGAVCEACTWRVFVQTGSMCLYVSMRGVVSEYWKRNNRLRTQRSLSVSCTKLG